MGSRSLVANTVTASILIMALALFMSPTLACLVTFAAAVAFLATLGKEGLTQTAFILASLTLSITSLITGVTAYLIGSAHLLLTSLMLGYASPAPLVPPTLWRLRGRRQIRAVLAVAILSVGILTLPLYSVRPLNAILGSSRPALTTLSLSGLYALIGYAPSSTAIVIGYLILIYTLVSSLKSFLQETSSQALLPPQPP